MFQRQEREKQEIRAERKARNKSSGKEREKEGKSTMPLTMEVYEKLLPPLLLRFSVESQRETQVHFFCNLSLPFNAFILYLISVKIGSFFFSSCVIKYH